MSALLTTHIPGLAEPRRGKVREVYDLGENVLIVATDRISAFDVVMANGVPDKGRILNQMSEFWFRKLANICPHHLITTSDSAVADEIGELQPDLAGRCTIARKAEPLTIECVARGYLAGSLFKEYCAEGGQLHGLDLPDGLADGAKLPEPLFTPATKATSGHDENISFAEACDRVGTETAELARKWTLELFAAAQAHAATAGLILADTKFEFGLCDDGLIWIDEALSPDSSRYWEAATYKPGGAQPSFDKQFVRDYLQASGWDKQPPGPTLPEDVVSATRAKYIEAYERVTGQAFRP